MKFFHRDIPIKMFTFGRKISNFPRYRTPCINISSARSSSGRNRRYTAKKALRFWPQPRLASHVQPETNGLARARRVYFQQCAHTREGAHLLTHAASRARARASLVRAPWRRASMVNLNATGHERREGRKREGHGTQERWSGIRTYARTHTRVWYLNSLSALRTPLNIEYGALCSPHARRWDCASVIFSVLRAPARVCS